MNDDEIQLWSDMLQYAISATQSISIRPVVIIEEIFLQLSKHEVNRSVWWTVCCILSHVWTPKIITCYWLCNTPCLKHQPPPLWTSARGVIHDNWRHSTASLSAAIASSSSLLLPVLMVIQNRLCIWIVDKEEVVPDTDYNDAVCSVIHFIMSTSWLTVWI